MVFDLVFAASLVSHFAQLLLLVVVVVISVSVTSSATKSEVVQQELQNLLLRLLYGEPK